MPRYEDAIKKPFSDIGKLAIGIILSMIPIASWIAKGYIIESSGLGTARPSYKLADWTDLGDLFVKGFLATVIKVVYLLPAMFLTFATVGGIIFSVLGNLRAAGVLFPKAAVASDAVAEIALNSLFAASMIGSVAIMLLAASFFALIALYAAPMGILNYLKTGELGAAFRLKEVFAKAFSWPYFKVWVVSICVSVLLFMVLSILPFVGDAAALFIAGIFSYTLFGEVYMSMEKRVERPPVARVSAVGKPRVSAARKPKVAPAKRRPAAKAKGKRPAAKKTKRKASTAKKTKRKKR